VCSEKGPEGVKLSMEIKSSATSASPKKKKKKKNMEEKRALLKFQSISSVVDFTFWNQFAKVTSLSFFFFVFFFLLEQA